MKRRHATWSIPRSATFVFRFSSENWRFHMKRHTQCCVRRRMLPPALGGLRVLRAAGPELPCTREYGKDQARYRGGSARPSTEHVNYSKSPCKWQDPQSACVGVAGLICTKTRYASIAAITHIRFHMCWQIRFALRATTNAA